MLTFVMLTRLSPDALRSPRTMEELEKEVMGQIRFQCPQVEWVYNLAVLGPSDYIDIFRAPDVDTAMRVSAIIRTYGHAFTEIWTATEWDRFKEMIHNISGEA